VIAQSNKIKDRIFDIKHGRVKEGLKIGIPEIDEYLRLKYSEGSLNLAIGHSNVGKTTVLVYLFTLWAIKHNLRFLIFSSENTPQSIVRKIIEFKMGKPIHTASEDLITKSISWADNHFKIIDADKIYTYVELLKEAKAIKDAWDYQGLLIDPYNSLARDSRLAKQYNGYEYNYYCLTELRLFSRQEKIAIWVNCHGVTDAMRKVYASGHDYEGMVRPLNMSDVEGGGAFGNRADDVVCIHRMTSHPNEWMFSHINVLKIKETETGGRCTPYEQPIKLRMALNNVGFEFMGKDIIHEKPLEKIKF